MKGEATKRELSTLRSSTWIFGRGIGGSCDCRNGAQSGGVTDGAKETQRFQRGSENHRRDRTHRQRSQFRCESSRPVWFVQDGNKLYLLPVTGSDSEWYKNLLTNAEITLAANGSKLSAKAKPIKDPKKVREIVEKFRAKHGAGEVKKYYSKFDVAVEVPLD